MTTPHINDYDRGPVGPLNTPLFDMVGFLMAYEQDDLDREAVIVGFQHLIDSGLAWQVQGHYGRTATALINTGLCTARKVVA